MISLGAFDLVVRRMDEVKQADILTIAPVEALVEVGVVIGGDILALLVTPVAVIKSCLDVILGNFGVHAQINNIPQSKPIKKYTNGTKTNI